MRGLEEQISKFYIHGRGCADTLTGPIPVPRTRRETFIYYSCTVLINREGSIKHKTGGPERRTRCPRKDSFRNGGMGSANEGLYGVLTNEPSGAESAGPVKQI